MQEVVERAQEQAVNVAVTNGIHVAAGDMSLKEALTEGAFQVVANVVGEVGANWACKLYDSGHGPVGYAVHKGMHFFAGGAMQAALNHRNAWEGFLTGGLAGMASEVFAEALPSDWSMQIRKDGAVLLVGLGAFFAGADVNTAASAARNAVENNFGMADAVREDAIKREQEALEGQRVGGEILCEAMVTHISGWHEFLEEIAEPHLVFHQELQEEIRQPGRSWQDRVRLAFLANEHNLVMVADGALPRVPLEFILLASPLGKLGTKLTAPTARGVFASGKAGASAFPAAATFEVRANKMFVRQGEQAGAKVSGTPLPGEGKTAFPANTNVKPHKNSLNYVGDTHVYSIHRDSDGKAVKVGESAQGYRKSDGASKRAEQQARRMRKETGEHHITKVRKNFEGKKDAREYETKLIQRARKMNGKDALPGNKSDH